MNNRKRGVSVRIAAFAGRIGAADSQRPQKAIICYCSAGALPRPPPKGSCRSQYPIRFVSRTTSPPCHFVTFPLSVNGEGEIKVALDLLSVPSIRTVHRTVLISAPLESTSIYWFFITFRNSSQLISRWGPSPIFLYYLY